MFAIPCDDFNSQFYSQAKNVTREYKTVCSWHMILVSFLLFFGLFTHVALRRNKESVFVALIGFQVASLVGILGLYMYQFYARYSDEGQVCAQSETFKGQASVITGLLWTFWGPVFCVVAIAVMIALWALLKTLFEKADCNATEICIGEEPSEKGKLICVGGTIQCAIWIIPITLLIYYVQLMK